MTLVRAAIATHIGTRASNEGTGTMKFLLLIFMVIFIVLTYHWV